MSPKMGTHTLTRFLIITAGCLVVQDRTSLISQKKEGKKGHKKSECVLYPRVCRVASRDEELSVLVIYRKKWKVYQTAHTHRHRGF